MGWRFVTGARPLVSMLQNLVAEYPEGVAAICTASLMCCKEFGCCYLLEGQLEVVHHVTCFAPNIFAPNGDEYNEN